jgi:hypothetical protein
MKLTQKQMRDACSIERFTKSPLVIDPDGSESLLLDDKGHTVAIAAYRHSSGAVGNDPANLEEKLANCERLVACWNACAGMPTAYLQEPGIVHELLSVAQYVIAFLPDSDDCTIASPREAMGRVLAKFRPFTPKQKAVIETLGAANITDDNTPMYDLKGFNDPAINIPAPLDPDDGWAHSGVDDSTSGLIKELKGYFADDKHEQLMKAFEEQQKLARQETLSLTVLVMPPETSADECITDPNYKIEIDYGKIWDECSAGSGVVVDPIRDQIVPGLGISKGRLTK